MKTHKMIEWPDVIRNSLQIKAQILTMDFRPDAILGIMRGGVIPATIMADIFRIPKWRLAFMETEYYHKDTPMREVTVGPVPDFLWSNLLVVDDICDSGMTMTAVMKKLRHTDSMATGRCKIVFSSLYWKIRPEGETLVAGEKAEDDQWLVFPWEFYSSVEP